MFCAIIVRHLFLDVLVLLHDLYNSFSELGGKTIQTTRENKQRYQCTYLDFYSYNFCLLELWGIPITFELVCIPG